jgi:hypothetical protein
VDGLEIAHRRVRAQHLAGKGLADPVAVVRHFGAMQAQEYAMAKWAIGQRTRGFDDAAVQEAVDDGRIVRTHALRPTWHFIAAEDIGWIQALTGPRVHVVNGHYYSQHGLDARTRGRTRSVLTDALRGGHHLTRPELSQALADAGISATGNLLAYVVMDAELEGLIGNGAMRGKQHTYALLNERVPECPAKDPDEALAELTRRYFTAHGPATVKDFAWWSSLTVTTIKQGLALLGDELESETVDGRTFWFVPGRAPRREKSPAVHLLQGYDEYVVAFTESRPLINVADRDFTLPEGNALVQPIIVDSQMVGYWRRTVAKGGITAELRLADDTHQAAIEAAFARYAEFAGVPVTVR